MDIVINRLSKNFGNKQVLRDFSLRIKEGTSLSVMASSGKGKTTLAVGKGIVALTRQKKVILIQFFKGSANKEGLEILRNLEPNLKMFRFEKSDMVFADLSEEEKAEELMNIRNGFNFAKKVVATGECDLLILDEVLGIIDQNIIQMEEFIKLLDARRDDTGLVMTGTMLPEGLRPYVDVISRIEYIEVDKEGEEC